MLACNFLRQVLSWRNELEHAPVNPDEWSKRFRGKRRYPRSGDKERSLLGKGGFGAVYRLRSSDVLYAAKVINLEDLGLDREQATKLEMEANLLQRLDHPHVIKYKGHFYQEDEVEFVLVMEYASGGCLADHIESEMSSELQLRLMTELASGLNYIHGMKVMHRDLKSSNILLAGDELALSCVKISDFGLSAHLSATAASKRTSKSGTALYFSPEKGREDPYDYAADMWAAGCILLELLLKESLKQALWPESKKEVLRQKLYTATYRNPHLGKQASYLLQHDPTKRSSAFDLFTALQQV